MKYMVESRYDIEGLVSAVNEDIEKGWKPVGGIAIEIFGNSPMHYCQSLVLEEKKAKNTDKSQPS